MLLYYKEMIQAIDLIKEDKRLTTVEFNKESAARPLVKTPPPPPEPPVTGAAKTLKDAEEAFGERRLDKAKQLFQSVLQQTDKLPQHASAYYGLGRIALLESAAAKTVEDKEKNLDDAERLFQKSLDCEPDPFDRGWDTVYLGRLAIAEGDKEKALKLLNSVLTMEGATDKAKQEAGGLLKTISKQ
jgi:tetratricopeptide (TPR) repeat protein